MSELVPQPATPAILTVTAVGSGVIEKGARIQSAGYWREAVPWGHLYRSWLHPWATLRVAFWWLRHGRKAEWVPGRDFYVIEKLTGSGGFGTYLVASTPPETTQHYG